MSVPFPCFEVCQPVSLAMPACWRAVSASACDAGRHVTISACCGFVGNAGAHDAGFGSYIDTSDGDIHDAVTDPAACVADTRVVIDAAGVADYVCRRWCPHRHR